MAALDARPSPVATSASGCTAQAADADEVSAAWFANPPLRYRPAAAVEVGATPVERIPEQLQGIVERGFGAMMLAPSEGRRGVDPHTTRDPVIQRVRQAAAELFDPAALDEVMQLAPPSPESDDPSDYLGDAYMRRYRAALTFAREHGLTAILYDELGYPTGHAGGGRIDPANFRKAIARTKLVAPPEPRTYAVPAGRLLAAVAMDEATKQRVDLTASVVDGALRWSAPGPGWTVQFFTLQTCVPQGGAQDYHAVVDYFDPVAVREFIDVTYEAYAREVGEFFGGTITTTFFDDVGIYSADRTWAAGIAGVFRERTGRDAATYYPALWEDVGQDTAPARIAFFAARAELLARGFPKLVTDWTAGHGLLASGHAPGQYEVQPTDMCADPFVFYRAQPIPMIDVIFKYGFGRDGFKLTTSAADTLDKPVVLAEQFTTGSTTTGYRRAMDSLVRGVNAMITSSRGDAGPPSAFAEWLGRCCMPLRGGRRVADIAIAYPIASLQAFYRFDAGDNQTGPVGLYAPDSADYLVVGDRLTGDLHRDFTFLHPDDLAGDRVRIDGGVLVLDSRVNRQEFSTLILPGGDVVPVGVLRKLRDFWERGGAIIATTLLPTRSAEFGCDAEVGEIVAAVFGARAATETPSRSGGGGAALFVPKPTVAALHDALNRIAGPPDVCFSGSPRPHSGNGQFAYIHKIKAGRHVVLVANSSDDDVEATVSIRGALELECWDPHTGAIRPGGGRLVMTEQGPRTEVPIELPAVRSLLLVGAETA
ncbi:MAG TPA: hypothetical protein VGQ42_17280 [Candidatus Dormibacteraeota bacterium]|nr:hypothetical protein [Candidatus Dormibacteraeota bacterium]